jgi:hypothetical protein
MTFLSLPNWLQPRQRRSALCRRRPGRHDRTLRARLVPRLEALEDRLVPSTLTVTTTADTGVAGDGSLRGAIAAAHSGDTINFDPRLAGQTITLMHGQLSVSKNLDIEGLGANQLTVSGNNASRVFDVSNNATVTIAGLTIANGRVVDDGGGGISNEAGSSLTLRNDTFSNNQAQGIGGALWNQDGATATISNSTFAGNKAIGFLGFFGPGNAGTEGGAIDDDGAATVTNSTFTNNQAIAGAGGVSEEGDGGAIAVDGSLTASGCTFTGNQALGGPVDNGVTHLSQGLGGAIVVFDASATISNSTFSGNEAVGGAGATSQPTPRSFVGVGGGVVVFAGGTLSVSGSSFDHNLAIGGAGGPGGAGSIGIGGGLEANGRNGGSVTVSDSSFTYNQAIGGAGGSGAAGGAGVGGGLSVDFNANATLSDLVLSNNLALGGAGGAGASGGNGYGGGLSVGSGPLFGSSDSTVATLTGVTITNNLAIGGDGGVGGNGGNGSGGGVFLGAGSTLSITEGTITGNHANGGDGRGGGADGFGVGGGIYDLGTLHMILTALANNHASTSNDDIYP